ncbi:MAG: hypothetical protein V4725_19085 [Bacteroidota bacterium]
MNSKFLLPIAVIFFLFSCQTTLGSNRKNQVIPVTTGNAQHLSTPKHNYLTIELISFEFPQEVNKASQGQPAQEDGKTHSYHFTRFDKRRWRLFYCLVAKLILLLAHVCFLICSYLHLTA